MHYGQGEGAEPVGVPVDGPAVEDRLHQVPQRFPFTELAEQ
jgi:hypothetical protein